MKRVILSAMVAISLFSGCDESNGGADNNASIVKKDPISKANSNSIYTGKGDDIESKAYYINSAGNKVDNPYYIPEKGKKGVTVGGNFGNRISVDLSDIENKFVIKTYFYDNNTEIHPDIDPGDVGTFVQWYVFGSIQKAPSSVTNHYGVEYHNYNTEGNNNRTTTTCLFADVDDEQKLRHYDCTIVDNVDDVIINTYTESIFQSSAQYLLLHEIVNSSLNYYDITEIVELQLPQN